MNEHIVDLTNATSVPWQQALIELKLFGLPVREEIVRCRDCAWISKDTVHYKACYRLEHEFAVEPDGFCAWGERRVDA